MESIDEFIAKYTCPAPPPSPFDDPNYRSISPPTAHQAAPQRAPQSMFAGAASDVTLVPTQNAYNGAAASSEGLQIRFNPKDPQFFPVITRSFMSVPLKIGRLLGPETENDPGFIPYNTKVISRLHAEIWEQNGDVFIKDSKSNSGTFLNSLRLSPAGQESKPFKIKDGDTVQFGVDFQGSQIRDHKSVVVTIQILGSAANPNANPMFGGAKPTGIALNNLTMLGGPIGRN